MDIGMLFKHRSIPVRVYRGTRPCSEAHQRLQYLLALHCSICCGRLVNKTLLVWQDGWGDRWGRWECFITVACRWRSSRGIFGWWIHRHSLEFWDLFVPKPVATSCNAGRKVLTESRPASIAQSATIVVYKAIKASKGLLRVHLPLASSCSIWAVFSSYYLQHILAHN
jgi:hypothetical protein